ncbi:hypothetical protein FUT69_02100 [Xylella taiwanensis]|uniref:Uncharacterized protein n=1 Tax=Xylella taiwanensis TaxID=1444770 RepID=Z9JMR2_9GAMM|nr:hypothetical protein [Xylella taiwanensis]EWS79076.1 hypothetical protein AF72_02300 [Xylella taiwanensis]MCD8457197.1 hypothetical protein [Xylella taiwanensis]MCD8459606.1 hypothetical protein [Xylella taiwanensis]MCD8461527.1 hypothetical protein [Xylella taiwanensis]MCD8462447.1 hypothetical protein [Xylella taiwanensis]
MKMQLQAFGMMDDNDYSRLIKLRSAKWGSRQEPNDHDRMLEKPRLLKRTMELLVDQGLVSADVLPAVLGLAARAVERLLGLAFSQLTTKKADVVELSLQRRDTADGVILRKEEQAMDTVVSIDRLQR